MHRPKITPRRIYLVCRPLTMVVPKKTGRIRLIGDPRGLYAYDPAIRPAGDPSGPRDQPRRIMPDPAIYGAQGHNRRAHPSPLGRRIAQPWAHLSQESLDRKAITRKSTGISGSLRAAKGITAQISSITAAISCIRA